MSEKRTITITAYRHEGATVCGTKRGMCQFLGTARAGMQYVCLAHHLRPIPETASGYLQPPQDGCIVWPRGDV